MIFEYTPNKFPLRFIIILKKNQKSSFLSTYVALNPARDYKNKGSDNRSGDEMRKSQAISKGNKAATKLEEINPKIYYYEST
jgi:hypothetical protein